MAHHGVAPLDTGAARIDKCIGATLSDTRPSTLREDDWA